MAMMALMAMIVLVTKWLKVLTGMLRGILTYCPVAHHPCKGQGEEEGNGAGHDDDYDDDDNDDDEKQSGVGDNRIKW